MSYITPYFWKTPITYLRWAAVEKPAIFYSILIGLAGPGIIAVAPPIRRFLGDERIPPIPLTYPIPTGPRKELKGYDDDE